MAKYRVHNASPCDISLDVVSIYGRSYHVVISRGQALDLYPLAGSVEACKNIAGLNNFLLMGYLVPMDPK